MVFGLLTVKIAEESKSYWKSKFYFPTSRKHSNSRDWSGDVPELDSLTYC